ncbi:DNA alkylation repair protein [Ornithinibacillus halophilus]|uniref:3-methyladenine DNA glycosylase AlkD n=1 Tax=Ornithinibacillus halophilus TaxID=930117 RepID=A0A1M5CIZ9_9BACI|nr:DNA alkylation repair protein [Ornithinibacillus halophilus]SHF54689.1 3-methyladenine DNA glycosylase AlkD [Ornithinibacillus halophilus]
MHLKELRELLEKNRNPDNAIHMERYMKNKFKFFGIKTPERCKITSQFFKDSGLLNREFNTDFVLHLWQQEEREFQNIGLDYIDRSLKKISKGHFPLIQRLITSKSWWDTVDMLAQKPVGLIAKNHPEIINQTIEGWSNGENLWLRRTSILFQLKYKEDTDEQLLYRYIKENVDSKEFFIQKAIGWALREYSKTNPESVRQFINENNLAKLSIREGSKYI